jgi:hypothetical protein
MTLQFTIAPHYIEQIIGLRKVGVNTLLVDPKGLGGAYTTLSGALSVISDASDTNEYLVIVTGEVAEAPGAVSALSHVHVLFLPGACLVINSASAGNGVTFSGVSNCVWAAVDGSRTTIIRSGAASASHGVYMTNVGATVRLVNINADNQVTGGASCYGMYLVGASPTLENCRAVGGAGGATSPGYYLYSHSHPAMTRCTGVGGSNGATCSGILLQADCSPEMVDCVGIGGNGGATCYGFRIVQGSHPTMRGCSGFGGHGGTGSHGISIGANCRPMLVRCTGVGGGVRYTTATAAVAASSRQDDAINPGAFPWRLIGIVVNVTAAAAGGVTLTFRSATGGVGDPLTGAVSVAALGLAYFVVSEHRLITAGNSIYGRLSAPDAALAYTAYYVYEHAYGTCYGLHVDTGEAVRFQDCAALSNCDSVAVYVTSTGILRSVFIGGTARSGLLTASRPKAFECQASWSPGQVFNMVLDGGSTNLTAAAGTANGSNVEL